MEYRLGHDFGQVRLHSGAKASESAKGINALSYTVGPNIIFADRWYNPRTWLGRHVLAHELTHVIQQGCKRVTTDQQIKWNGQDEYERQADAAAINLQSGHRNTFVGKRVGASLMMLTPKQFRKQLSSTPDQKKAIAVLFANKTFLSLWNYLKKCTAVPKKDLGPLVLKVTPGLTIGGVERFGGYSPMTRTLKINPTKPEHQSNPTELVDTITHEFIHAVDDLEQYCVKAGAKAAPLGGAATESPPELATVAGTPVEKKMMQELGPGASNPCEEFLDINKAAQQMIIQILKNNMQVTKVGRPTVTFVNEILRREPKAMKEYVSCRKTACAKLDAADRSKAVAKCSADILSKYMPKDLKP
jgi:hypothetical protein